MSNPQAIDPFRRSNRIDVPDTVLCLDQDRKAGPPVGGGETLRRVTGRVAVVRDVQRHAALSHRRILHARDDMGGLLA